MEKSIKKSTAVGKAAIEQIRSALDTSEKERERLKNALDIIEKKLNVIIQNVSDIIYTLDSNGLITFINGEVQRFGFSPDELIGVDIFEIVHPLDRERSVYKVNERRTGDRGTKGYQVHLMTKALLKNRNGENTDNYTRSPLLTINAEGHYVDHGGNNYIFEGTIGIASDRSSDPATMGERKDLKDVMAARSEKEETEGMYLPICAGCKSIRLESGEWEHIETFLGDHYGLKCTHTICPECMKKLYPDIGE